MSVAGGVNLAEQSAQGHNIESFGDSVWWAIVTVLTVGYGDKYPVTPTGRWMAAALMISGVFAIAIVTAKISSYFLERALLERRGVVDTESLKNHYIICGWKEEMVDFLMHFLDGNPQIKPKQVVLVTSAPEAEIDQLHEIERLKPIGIVRGEHYLEVNLRRAAPERATKILILADATPNAAGQIPTITEADARTIMTAMSLSNIARGIPVAAELIDASMDQYLRLAHVSEIIYSREHSRLLLALASGGVGIINVYHALLSPHGNCFVATRTIPQEWVGKTYGELQKYQIESDPKATLIGVLENSGNSFVAKEAALHRAQQTPNVRELVNNLQAVKALKFNHPIMNPGTGYQLVNGTMMIVIEERTEVRAVV